MNQLEYAYREEDCDTRSFLTSGKTTSTQSFCKRGWKRHSKLNELLADETETRKKRWESERDIEREKIKERWKRKRKNTEKEKKGDVEKKSERPKRAVLPKET